MKYSLEIFKKNNIPYSWATLYVGDQLGILDDTELEKFAVEYLLEHPTCTLYEIVELASGINYKIFNLQTLLLKIFQGLNYPAIEKDGPEWNIEKRKWRYCILKEIEKTTDDSYDFFLKFGIINADFGYPEDMESFLYDETTFNQSLKDKLTSFLTSELEKIKSNDSTWPTSSLYPPY